MITRNQPQIHNVIICMGQSLMDGPSDASGGQQYVITGRAHDHRLDEFTAGGTTAITNIAERMNATNPVDPMRMGMNVVLARRLAAKGVQNIVTLKRAFGGHSIVSFIPSADRLAPIPSGDGDHATKNVVALNDQLRFLGRHGARVNLLGFVWYQGSSDRGESQYYTNYQAHLLACLDYYRTNITLADASTPWLIARSPTWGAPNPTTGVQTVQAAQMAVADADEHAAWVSTDYPFGVNNSFQDGTHPTKESWERIGCVMADAFYQSFIA